MRVMFRLYCLHYTTLANGNIHHRYISNLSLKGPWPLAFVLRGEHEWCTIIKFGRTATRSLAVDRVGNVHDWQFLFRGIQTSCFAEYGVNSRPNKYDAGKEKHLTQSVADSIYLCATQRHVELIWRSAPWQWQKKCLRRRHRWQSNSMPLLPIDVMRHWMSDWLDLL
jgi:hypothetical protein